MSDGLELGRPRDLSTLLRDALRVYFRHFPAFVLLAAAVVVPVHLAVSGIGLEQLTSGYDATPGAPQLVIPALVSFLVVSPLITAACIHALREVAEGRKPPAGGSLAAGFEAFTPIFAPLAVAAVGITLGLFAFVVPGVYLLVRWFFVPQAVVIEGARGLDALRSSGEVVRGSWLRAFGVILLANLLAAIPGLLVTAPFAAAADSADRAVFELAGSAFAATLTAPFVALVATLLYYDLKARS